MEGRPVLIMEAGVNVVGNSTRLTYLCFVNGGTPVLLGGWVLTSELIISKTILGKTIKKIVLPRIVLPYYHSGMM